MNNINGENVLMNIIDYKKELFLKILLRGVMQKVPLHHNKGCTKKCEKEGGVQTPLNLHDIIQVQPLSESNST